MSEKILVEDLEVVKMFMDEWAELLEGLEKEILRLEVESDDEELVNDIFRRVHSIKGGSSFVGLPALIGLSHETEFTLDAVRKKQIGVTADLIDSLLSAADFIGDYVSNLAQKIKNKEYIEENGRLFLETDSDGAEAAVMEALKKARESAAGPPSEPKTPPAAEPDAETLKADPAVIREQFLSETAEHADRIEEVLAALLAGRMPEADAISEIFRSVHSMKGGAGIWLAALPENAALWGALRRFAGVLHSFENLLSAMRAKNLPPEKEFLDLLYLFVDGLRLFLHGAARETLEEWNENELKVRIEAEVVRVDALPARAPAGSASAAPVAPAGSAGGAVTQSLRVSREKIDTMMNMISELVIVRNSFMHLSSRVSLEYDLPEISKEIKQIGANLNRISEELQNAVMSVRMVEIKTLFQKMPRVVRDIAQSTGKRMELYMEGETTEIDKTIVEQISDPLVHLIRNAADHGIESLEERRKRGKPETGRIVLRAYNKNKTVCIEIEDDGKGIDAEQIKSKALEKGFLDPEEAQRMTPDRLINLIFLPGFSTAGKVTEVSGRGVGMDIVKNNIAKINGRISVESEKGRGTKMIVRLPLTLAVSRGLLVESAGEKYIFPLESVSETVKIRREDLREHRGRRFTCLRGEVLGAEDLCRIFYPESVETPREEYNAVILNAGNEKFAVFVDRFLSEQEFVVKTPEGVLARVPGIAGSTFLGNGRVVLIVNPAELMRLARNESISKGAV